PGGGGRSGRADRNPGGASRVGTEAPAPGRTRGQAPPLSSPPLIKTRGLGRVFGSRTALRHVGLTVGAGEILALFGPNGAGKTTLLRILASLLRPSRGQAFLGGMDIASLPLRGFLCRRL